MMKKSDLAIPWAILLVLQILIALEVAASSRAGTFDADETDFCRFEHQKAWTA